MSEDGTIYRHASIIGVLAIVLGLALAALLADMPYSRLYAYLNLAESELRHFIAAQPIVATLAAGTLYFVLSLIPGTLGKSIVIGWLFGFWLGVLIVIIGLTLAGSLTYWLSRGLLHNFVTRQFHSTVTMIDDVMSRDNGFYLLTIRLTNIPWSLVNWVCGAIRVRFATFLWTMIAGLTPSTLVFVNIGAQLPSLKLLANECPSALVSTPIMLSLAALAVVPFLIRLVYRFLGSKVSSFFNREGERTDRIPPTGAL